MFLNLGAARAQRDARAMPQSWQGFGAEDHTVISSDLAIVGDVATDGHIEVQGQVEGTTNSETVLIGESGFVDGLIAAEFAEIRGTVYGIVRANHVIVGKDARVVGTVFHHTLTVEPGGVIDGRRPWRPRVDRKPAANTA
jgi:cytoskeletal protein CcmA (bactofilin family)